jgi:hypothetical protein
VLDYFKRYFVGDVKSVPAAFRNYRRRLLFLWKEVLATAPLRPVYKIWCSRTFTITGPPRAEAKAFCHGSCGRPEIYSHQFKSRANRAGSTCWCCWRSSFSGCHRTGGMQTCGNQSRLSRIRHPAESWASGSLGKEASESQ